VTLTEFRDYERIEGESVEATTTSPISTSYDRWQMLGGDRFYTMARWVTLLLLLGMANLITEIPIWPPSVTMPPFLLLLWGFAFFNILTTLALFIPFLGGILRIAFFIDVLFVTLLTLFARNTYDLFYPLYLLPLIGFSVRSRPIGALIFGLFVAAAYIGSYLFARVGPDNGRPPRELLEFVALALRSLILIIVPVLTSGLSERWGITNRRSVVLAEKQTEQAMHEARLTRDQMRSLYEVAYTLSTTMNYQNVLNVALVESRKLVPYTSGVALLSTGEPDELYVAAGQGISPSEHEMRIKIGGGQIAQVLRSSDACIMSDISQETELLVLPSFARCRSACLVPLRAGLRTFGLMLVASDHPNAFNQEQLAMLTALANYAILALQNAQLVHDLREERTKLLSKEEEVRRQLARDLHDGPAQALAAITMNVEFIKRLLERDPARVLPELERLGALAKHTTHEVRTMLFELRPLVLETQGLQTTLEQYLERFQGNGTEIILEASDITASLDTKSEGTLFNIIQEAINNALKYAKAQHIWVRLKQSIDALEVTVQDDGRGFDLKRVLASYEQRGSFGLLNIEERAKLIGGISELQSAPGEGTTVRVVVPLNQT
jgi:signal transduction histidine kinase